jgi:predicted restriction endonuclease
MRRPVVDDVLAVLSEVQYRFQMSGLAPSISMLRKDAVKAVAGQELAAKRFTNRVSAEHSIGDACDRRLNKIKIATFDHFVEDWLKGNPDALREAVLKKPTTIVQRQRIAELLGPADSQLVTPLVQDLAEPPSERVKTTVSRVVRDTKLSNRVKWLHGYECQICGESLILADGSRYAEGHHVQPLGSPHDGPDVLGNILCLCPNDHARCDMGAIEIITSKLRHAVGHAVDQRYIDYHNLNRYRGGIKQRGA